MVTGKARSMSEDIMALRKVYGNLMVHLIDHIHDQQNMENIQITKDLIILSNFRWNQILNETLKKKSLSKWRIEMFANETNFSRCNKYSIIIYKLLQNSNSFFIHLTVFMKEMLFVLQNN